MRTRVGYAGGRKKNPTYYRLGDHTETLQIDYDPTKISYEEILHIFWNTHYPDRRAWSRQYMSAVFYHNEEQKKIALQTKDRHQAKLGRQIFTEMEPLSHFYLAEDYHQKYILRQNRHLMKEFKAIYPDDNDFVNSTAAARINGYLAGYGTPAALETELDALGLSPEGKKTLQDKVYAYHK